MAPNQTSESVPATNHPKILTVGSMRCLLQNQIVSRILSLIDAPSAKPSVLYLAETSCNVTTTSDYKCMDTFAETCTVKAHNLKFDSIETDLDNLLAQADVVVCNWNISCHNFDTLRKALFSYNFVLCAVPTTMNAILEEQAICHWTKWRYHPAEIGMATFHNAPLLLEEGCKEVIGIDLLAAHLIVGENAMALSGNGRATCHIFYKEEGEIVSSPLPTGWEEPIPQEELIEFPIPATNEHLDSLEEYVDQDFVIADDVIQESSHSSEMGSDVFPKIVAAGKPGALQMQPIFEKIIELSGVELPRVLFVGTASFDRTDKFNSNTKKFREIGCEVRRLDVSDDETVPSPEEMRELVVDWANVIMCAGGNTLHALIRWKEIGLDLLIKEASMKGAVLCGGSAGAGCWFSSLHTDSLRPDNTKNKEHVLNELTDDELKDWDYTKISALGFIDAMCIPHFDKTGTNGNARSDDAEQILHQDPSTHAIGVDENAALVVVGDQAMAVSGDGKATCHVVVPDEETGEVISAPLPTSWEEPVPLEEVLDFPIPATNEHLESLEDYVNKDFVIADDVIARISEHSMPRIPSVPNMSSPGHRRTKSQGKPAHRRQRSGHHRTNSEISVDELFPKIVAAGKPSALQMQPIFEKIIELSGVKLPKVLFIGTASFDRTDKFNSNTKKFREIGCEVRRLNVSEPDDVPPLEEMRELVVDWADVIMCAGGNTLHALIRWKETGLDLLIKESSMKGTVLCGGSAGAGCWFSSLHTDSLRPDNTKNKEQVLADKDEEELADWDYARISALGFIDAMCVPHFDKTGTNGNARSEDAKRFLEEDPSTPAIGVEENAALVVVGNEMLAVSGDGKATCHVVVPDQETGEVISAPLPTTWKEGVPIEEVFDFPVAATNEHLESLEDYVDHDFVIANEVIPELSIHSAQNKSTGSGDVVFPKIVATGKPSAMQLQPIFDKIIDLTGVELPKVLFIGTASFDRTDRVNSNTKRFRDIGCEVCRLDVSDPETTPSLEEMRQMVVDWADVIMCAGGNTLHALIRWKDIGLDLLIKEAALKGTVLCGGSAGAGCWFSSLHTDSLRPDNAKNKEHVLYDMDEEALADWEYTRISGLGFIDAMCVPHFDKTGTNGNARSDDAKKFVKEEPSTPAIGVDENAALVVIGNEVLAVSGDGLAMCHIMVPDEKTGEIITRPLPTTPALLIGEILKPPAAAAKL